MKGFIWGVLATLVGGVLLWYATDLAASWKASGAQVVKYQSAATGSRVIVTRELLARMAKLEPGAVLSTVKIENAGSEDIDNVSFLVRTEYNRSGTPIKDIGVLQLVPSDADEPKLSITDKGAIVSYKLLRSGEGVVLWAGTDDVSELKVRAERKGLKIEETSPWQTAGSNISIWWALIIAVVSLFIGLGVAEVSNRAMLRKIGLEPADVLAAYNDASKKKT